MDVPNNNWLSHDPMSMEVLNIPLLNITLGRAEQIVVIGIFSRSSFTKFSITNIYLTFEFQTRAVLFRNSQALRQICQFRLIYQLTFLIPKPNFLEKESSRPSGHGHNHPFPLVGKVYNQFLLPSTCHLFGGNPPEFLDNKSSRDHMNNLGSFYENQL